jgi:DNA-directed RNA polymerase specialized sigma24 family protein
LGFATHRRDQGILALVNDAELLQAWANGNKSAGEQLFERHFEAIARFFRNKLPADTQHEDLIQQTFLGCVEARDRFRGDASFRSFLFAIAHNQKLLLALRRIPLDSQVALELHYWEAMTAAEIGEVLDVPLGTAKTRLRRAKQLLEAELLALDVARERWDPTGSGLDTWAREIKEALFEGVGEAS